MVSDFVLASTSPRRHALLNEAGYRFDAVDPGEDGPSAATTPEGRVLDHARHKARAGQKQALGRVVLASDTLVWCAGEVLPKPTDQADAARMLGLLAERDHEVWTGVCVLDSAGQVHERAAVARVRFGAIPAPEAAEYLAGQEWADKAGAYAIQGTAGRWCALIEGDYNTVVGLPLALVSELLRAAGACSDPPVG